jgi:DNA-binding transcriptional regulator YhcF (GntR family)
MIPLDPNSPIPPYEQVRAGLAKRITDHELPIGAKLPTVRALAAELGIAVNTVARSYRELEEAGLVETRGRAGTFVASAGNRPRELVHEAAEHYATLCRRYTIPHDEAVAIIQAALAR